MNEIITKINIIIDLIQRLPFTLESVDDEKNANFILEKLKIELRNLHSFVEGSEFLSNFSRVCDNLYEKNEPNDESVEVKKGFLNSFLSKFGLNKEEDEKQNYWKKNIENFSKKFDNVVNGIDNDIKKLDFILDSNPSEWDSNKVSNMKMDLVQGLYDSKEIFDKLIIINDSILKGELENVKLTKAELSKIIDEK